METTDLRTAPASARVRLESIGIAGWRVLHRDRGVIGHVQVRSEAAGDRFIARRFHTSLAAFGEVGRFWSMDEAIDVLLTST